jgi:UDP-N-acetylmuramate-alanine ligase
MGIDEDDFYEAVATFKGASKRLEKIVESKSSVVFKDFAHSPSKVMATAKAVREQFPEMKLIACLELHTFSSLNPEFLKEYNKSLEPADEAVVFFSPESLEIKKMEPISKDQIRKAFDKENLIVYTTAQEFKEHLQNLDYSNAVLLLMSSGNYGGLDFEEIKNWVS